MCLPLVKRGVVALLFLMPMAGCERGEPLGPDASPPIADDLLSKKCGVCHAVPGPQAHTAAEWPAVIMRMQSRRTAQGFAPLSDDEVEAITKILQKDAKSK